MAQFDSYDPDLAIKFEKMWREQMLAGAKRDFEEAITRQIGPIERLIDNAKADQAARLDLLDQRIERLEQLDARLAELARQLETGTSQFAATSAQLADIPAIVEALGNHSAKIGLLDEYLANLQQRANQPDNLTRIAAIVDDEAIPEADRLMRARGLIGDLQAGLTAAAVGQPETGDGAAKAGLVQRVKALWLWLANRIKPRPVLVILVGVAAFLLVLTVVRTNPREDREAAPLPSDTVLTDPAETDRKLLRDGWEILGLKAPSMVTLVERSCNASPCDIVGLLDASRANKTNRKLAEAILQLPAPVAGAEPPPCEYKSVRAMLEEARSSAARPQTIRACVIHAQMIGGRADSFTADDWDDRLRAYLIAIGSMGDLGESIEPVRPVPQPSATAPAARPTPRARTSPASSAAAAAPVPETAAPGETAAGPTP